MDEEHSLDPTAVYIQANCDGEGIAGFRIWHVPLEQEWSLPLEGMFMYEHELDPEMYRLLKRLEPVIQERPDTGVYVKVEGNLVPGQILRSGVDEEDFSRRVSLLLDPDKWALLQRRDGTVMYRARTHWRDGDEFLGPYWEPGGPRFGVHVVPIAELMECLEQDRHLWRESTIRADWLYCPRCDWLKHEWEERRSSR